VTAEIVYPNFDNPSRYAKSGGDLDARPTIDEDALDDLASLSNADCSVP
jgi:hypothetical protein